MMQAMEKSDRDTTAATTTTTTTGQATAGGAANDAAAVAAAAADRPSEGIPLLVAVAMIAGAAVLRLVIYNDRLLPIGFGVPLVLFGWLRSRRYLWVTAAAFIGITFVKF